MAGTVNPMTRRRDRDKDEHMDMGRTAFCDRRSRPGTDRMSSGGLRAQPHFHFPTPSRRQGHQWLESGGSVIPLRVSSGLPPDSCAGVSPQQPDHCIL